MRARKIINFERCFIMAQNARAHMEYHLKLATEGKGPRKKLFE